MRKILFLVLSFIFVFSQEAQALYIRNWLICGAFEGMTLEDEAIKNESELSPEAGDVSSGQEWREFNAVKDTIDLEGPLAFGMHEEAVGYAFCKINSPSERIVLLKLRSDDGIKVWLNGENVLTNDVARGLDKEEDVVTLYLKKGDNRLLLKINDLYGGWGFSCNLVSLKEKDEEDLKFIPQALPLERILVKNITASSVQGGEMDLYSPLYLVDGDTKTRWSSQHFDPQYITFEFRQPELIKRIDLLWETAYGKAYTLTTSLDGKSWQEIYATSSSKGGHEIIVLDEPQKAKFLKLFASERATDWGYSLWELEVYGFKEGKEKISYQESVGEIELVIPKPLQVKEATASGVQSPNVEKDEYFYAKFAVDNNLETRWSSEFADPQWIMLDFGNVKEIEWIKLVWEAAFAKKYKVETSNDAQDWSELYSTKDSDGGIDLILLDKPASARYLRVFCEERATDWGYSLWEIEVYGR